jgi:hypothetical protein
MMANNETLGRKNFKSVKAARIIQGKSKAVPLHGTKV